MASNDYGYTVTQRALQDRRAARGSKPEVTEQEVQAAVERLRGLLGDAVDEYSGQHGLILLIDRKVGGKKWQFDAYTVTNADGLPSLFPVNNPVGAIVLGRYHAADDLLVFTGGGYSPLDEVTQALGQALYGSPGSVRVLMV